VGVGSVVEGKVFVVEEEESLERLCKEEQKFIIRLLRVWEAK
jgi:hypothetical protein